MPALLLWILVGAGAALFVVATFLQRELIFHAAYVLLATAVGLWMEDSPFFRILFGVLVWFMLVLFHVYVWKEVVQRIRRSGLAPAGRSAPEDLVGAIGDVKMVGDHKVVRVLEEDWSYDCDDELPVGASVQVTGADGDRLQVRRLEDRT